MALYLTCFIKFTKSNLSKHHYTFLPTLLCRWRWMRMLWVLQAIWFLLTLTYGLMEKTQDPCTLDIWQICNKCNWMVRSKSDGVCCIDHMIHPMWMMMKKIERCLAWWGGQESLKSSPMNNNISRVQYSKANKLILEKDLTMYSIGVMKNPHP